MNERISLTVSCRRKIWIYLTAILTFVSVQQALGIWGHLDNSRNFFIALIIMFAVRGAVPYFKIFNETVNISKDDKYIYITRGSKEKRYVHEDHAEIRVLEASALAPYDELSISLPMKKIKFILSVDERNAYNKVNEWKAQVQ